MNSMENPINPTGMEIIKLHQLETRRDLLQYKVDGWCIWPIFRFDVAMEIADLPLSPRKRFSRFEQFWIALVDLRNYLHLPQKSIVVKSYSSSRSYEENGKRKDVFFDDLLAGSEQVFRIEGINNRKMFLERSADRYPADITSMPIEIAAGALALLPWLAPDCSEIAKKINQALVEDLQITSFSKSWISAKIRYFYWGKKLYRRLFEKVGARKYLLANPGEYASSAAAKELGIPVYEFQHGIVSHEFNSFYSWTEYAKPYKKSLPLSDVLCLFGDYWKSNLLATGFWDKELRSTGRIFLDSFRGASPRKEKKTCDIVFTSQGLDREKIIAFIQEFSSRADAEGFRYHLHIKMHPVYDAGKSFYADALHDNPNVTIYNASENPSTFDLLSQADLHWSISSTCHYDALGLGVQTVILALSTYETILPLYDDGYAFLARDGSELFEVTRKQNSYVVPEEVREKFFVSGALENNRKELDLQ